MGRTIKTPTKDEIAEDIKQFAKKYDRPPKRDEYKESEKGFEGVDDDWSQ